MRLSFSVRYVPAGVILAALTFNLALADQPPRPPKLPRQWQVRPYADGLLITPPSSIRTSKNDTRVHSNVLLFVPPLKDGSQRQAKGPPFSGYAFNTPASIACMYKQTVPSQGCDPAKVTENPSGGSKVIAIVDPFDAPNIAADLSVFSAQFGLPAPTDANFQVVYASGSKPPADSGWEMEASPDVQAAHAMAPEAKIILVEAASDKIEDLLAAVDKAGQLVAAAGGGEVSISWGGGEVANELSYQSHFTTAGVVYIICTDDGTGTVWPAVFPNVVAVGATSVVRDASGAFIGESAWLSEGAGPSKYVPRPKFQDRVAGVVGKKRGTVDVAAVGDPATGLWVYNKNIGGEFDGWTHAGGTSLAAPLFAGIVNRAGHFYRSTADELTAIYGSLGNPNNFTDITDGICGPNHIYKALPGWDFCSGVGSPVGTDGK